MIKESTAARIGGMWDEIGTLQFNFLKEQGLEPHHKLLDIGCGTLRGGVHFIAYLDTGNYYGIDSDSRSLNLAVEEILPEYNLESENAHLLHNSSFQFNLFGETFDYAIAQSVFTHLPKTAIELCISSLKDVLTGSFYATFFEYKEDSGNPKSGPVTHNGNPRIITYENRDPYHYSFNELSSIAQGAGMEATYIGDWNHPRDQKIIRINHVNHSRPSICLENQEIH